MLLKSFLSVVFLMGCHLAFSQAMRISGKVISETNEPVAGATILVNETKLQTITNVDGGFTVSLEKPGIISVTVSAIGFSSKSISDIDAQSMAEDLIITLEHSVQQQETIIIRSVSRRHESTNALLNFQRNHSALSSGLAADFIKRTPDRNTGEILKRVSGASIQDNKYVIIRGLSDRYNQALINDAQMPSSEPDKKAFSFDMIPSMVIDNIIINKTATPDLPGEFAGGLVQINTKDIPVSNIITVGVSAGYNSQSTFKNFTSNKRNSNDWLGFDDGTRSLPENIPSVAGYRSLTDAQKMQATRRFNGDVYGEVRYKAAPVSAINLAWSNVKSFKNQGKFGSVISLYHRRAMIIYDDVQRGRFEEDRAAIFSGTETQNRYSINAGALANFTYIKGRHKISFKNLFNQLFEDNYINRTLQNNSRIQTISLRSSFLNQRSLYSGQLEGDHMVSASGIKFKWNGNFSYNHKTQPDFRTAQFGRPLHNNTAAFELDDDDTRRFFSDLKDFSYGGHASLAIPFSLAGNRQSLKFGGGTMLRYRDFNSRVFRYKPASTATDIHIPFDQAFQTANIKDEGLFLEDQTQNTDKYIGASALNNAYVMFDNKLGDKLRMIWGFRAEFFEQFLTSKDLSLKRIIVNTEKWNFLPSLNLTYSLTKKHQLRASASQTVARPEFREIAPFQFFDYEQIWGVAGNTELKSTSILNADVRYEYYPKAGEVISVGLLAKSFNDPIELRMDGGSNSDRWLYTYANADKAFLYGAEIEIRKDLSFISEKLSHLTLIGNFTYLESKVTLSTEQASGNLVEQDRPLFGQSPYIINGGLQFNNNGWNATALYNRLGPRISLVGDPNGAGFYDIYEKPRNVLDLQLSKKVLNDKGEWKVTVSDLFNDPYTFYDNFSSEPGYNFSKGDRINYSYSPGTSITVGFTYDFDLNKK